ncbi:MAG TPA: type IV pili methyl-accepting chemotaxis transducer N-terminal domain-containing protein [Gammaproteobacteria bacterium]|nr:type IV pili methyl-accepting chemotaxis transducer N-terminal domain-containing protein [Gammaproteobacteria bacterium]
MGFDAVRPRGRWRSLVFALAGLTSAVPVYARDAPPSALEAVNLAGRERMLSQRATKAWLMRGQGILVEQAEAILSASIAQFEAQLDSLRAAPGDATTRAALDELALRWAEMKALLETPPSAAAASALYDANEAVQSAAHQLTLTSEDLAPAPYAHLLNLAGRQRMLSQRMAKFFLYRSWEVNGDAAGMELELSHAHFGAVLIQLEVSKLLDAQARAEVAALRAAWRDYQALLIERNAPATMRANAPAVVRASEEVLEKTERVVAAILETATR